MWRVFAQPPRWLAAGDGALERLEEDSVGSAAVSPVALAQRRAISVVVPITLPVIAKLKPSNAMPVANW
ncbi:MAG: hypothetical protein M1837_000566 [Sclerophora amabilis]|nr:MAG: hypothetical protein M1837_000566 [Sclerophora amabilis]